MEFSKSKCVNFTLNIIGVSSLRLGSLQIIIYFFKKIIPSAAEITAQYPYAIGLLLSGDTLSGLERLDMSYVIVIRRFFCIITKNFYLFLQKQKKILMF